MGEGSCDQEVIGMGSLPRRQVIITLIGVLIALFLSSLDQTVVSTAMPRIVADLGGFAHYTWLTTIYIVTSTVVLPIVGKLTDIYGRKNFYTAGLIIFVVGSLLSGISQSMLQIIIFRGVQGIGGGIMLGNAFTVIGDLFPPAERGKYQGLVSGVFGVSAIIGPALGGFITDAFSWHWIFFINIPLGILNILLFIFWFPDFRMENVQRRIDYWGIVFIILSVIPLLLALSLGGIQYPWISFPIIALFAVSLISLIVLPAIEYRNHNPIIPLRVFRNPIVSMSIPVIFLSGVGMFGGIIFIPLYFQGVLGMSAASSGSFLTPLTLGQVVGSFLAGQLLSRAGGHYRFMGAAGLALMAGGLLILSNLTVTTSFVTALTGIILTGFGLGITLPLYTIVIQNAVTYNILGAATSMVPFFRFMGGAVGLTIFGSVLINRFTAEFLARVPDAVRNMITPDLLSSLTSSLLAPAIPGSPGSFQSLFAQLGNQSTEIYNQTLAALHSALDASLTLVFFITFLVTIAAFIIALFIKEIPLRKKHVVSGDKDMPKTSVG